MRKPNFFGGKFAILIFGSELPIPAFFYPFAASGGCHITNFAQILHRMAVRNVGWE
jgi:hypothetical protein